MCGSDCVECHLMLSGAKISASTPTINGTRRHTISHFPHLSMRRHTRLDGGGWTNGHLQHILPNVQFKDRFPSLFFCWGLLHDHLSLCVCVQCPLLWLANAQHSFNRFVMGYLTVALILRWNHHVAPTSWRCVWCETNYVCLCLCVLQLVGVAYTYLSIALCKDMHVDP